MRDKFNPSKFEAISVTSRIHNIMIAPIGLFVMRRTMSISEDDAFQSKFQLPAESGDQSSWTNQSKMPESMSGPISFLQLNLIITMEAEPRCDPIHILFRPTSNMMVRYFEMKWKFMFAFCAVFEIQSQHKIMSCPRLQKFHCTDVQVYIVSWEPEGHYHCSKMYCWEQKECYRCTVNGDNALLVLSGTLLNKLMPLWLSANYSQLYRVCPETCISMKIDM